MDNSHNRYGAESVKLFVGDELIYHSVVDELSFDKQRCKNSTFDYSYFLNDKKHVHKLFIEPNNDLKIFHYSVNDGMFAIEVGQSEDILIEVTDYNGNVSYANFTINGVENTNELCYNSDAKLEWDQSYVLLEDLCRVEIDSACLFKDIEIPFVKISEYKYSSSYKVGEDDIPLKKDFKISFYIDDEISHLRDKLFVARVQNDKFSYLKPSFNQNYISASASYFGEFYLWVDTTAPKITPKNISEGKNMKGSSYIELTMADDLSGIYDYDMYINDIWVLGDYYPKKKRLRYYFDSKMPTAEKYELRVVVADQHKNVSEYKVNFRY